MNKTIFTLILLATGAFFVILSQGKQLHLLIFASFLIATAITSFIDSTYKDIQGNSAEVDIKTDKLLGILDGIGIKGRFTTSIAVLFFSFILLSLFTLAVFRIIPHSIKDAMNLAGMSQDETLSLNQDYDKGPLNEVEIRHGENRIGRLTEVELIAELEQLANAGIARKEISSITDKIRNACTLKDGLCKVTGLYRVSVAFTQDRELDRHPYLKANICPAIDGKANFIRTRLREGHKIRIHPMEEGARAVTNLQSTATPYMGNREVGTYDPFPEEQGNIPREASRACRGNVPFIQLPLSYLDKYEFEQPEGQFTSAYLTIEKEELINKETITKS
jgi:hypothetical protein